MIAAGNDAVWPVKSIVLSFDISKSAKLKCCDISIPKKRDIKMQWKYVVLQYLVLGPGLGLEPQVLVNITAHHGGGKNGPHFKKSLKLKIYFVTFRAMMNINPCTHIMGKNSIKPIIKAKVNCALFTVHEQHHVTYVQGVPQNHTWQFF